MPLQSVRHFRWLFPRVEAARNTARVPTYSVAAFLCLTQREQCNTTQFRVARPFSAASKRLCVACHLGSVGIIQSDTSRMWPSKHHLTSKYHFHEWAKSGQNRVQRTVCQVHSLHVDLQTCLTAVKHRACSTWEGSFKSPEPGDVAATDQANSISSRRRAPRCTLRVASVGLKVVTIGYISGQAERNRIHRTPFRAIRIPELYTRAIVTRSQLAFFVAIVACKPPISLCTHPQACTLCPEKRSSASR